MKRDKLQESLRDIKAHLEAVQASLQQLLEANEAVPMAIKPSVAPAPALSPATNQTEPFPSPAAGFVPLQKNLMVVLTLDDGRELHAIADGQGGCWNNGRLFMEPGAPDPTPEQLGHCVGWTRAKLVTTQGRTGK